MQYQVVQACYGMARRADKNALGQWAQQAWSSRAEEKALSWRPLQPCGRINVRGTSGGQSWLFEWVNGCGNAQVGGWIRRRAVREVASEQVVAVETCVEMNVSRW